MNITSEIYKRSSHTGSIFSVVQTITYISSKIVSAQDYVLPKHSVSTLALMTFQMDNSLMWGLLPVWSLSASRMSFAPHPLVMTMKNVSTDNAKSPWVGWAQLP